PRAVDRAVVGDDEELDAKRPVEAEVRLEDVLLVADLVGHHELHRRSARSPRLMAAIDIGGRLVQRARAPQGAHRSGDSPALPVRVIGMRTRCPRPLRGSGTRPSGSYAP